MNKRSFLKRAGLLTGLAVLNPLKLLGLFKPKPALSMETMKAAFDQIYFSSPEPVQTWTITHVDKENKTATFEPGLYGGKVATDRITNLSFWNGKQWIPVED